MDWIVSLQLLFGILFAHRTFHQLRQKNLIEDFWIPKLSMLVFTLFFLITYAARANPLSQMAALAMVGVVLFSFDPIFQWRLQSRISREFPDFVGKIILVMKTGFSFRGALEKILDEPSELWEKCLRAMIESRVLLHTDDNLAPTWWSAYLRELRLAEQNPHLALTRLENFRRKLKVLSEFRRKSGQALLQARIQMLVMTCLYFALLMLTMTQFQLNRHPPVILLSLGLFIAGQVLFWWIARKRKWKT